MRTASHFFAFLTLGIWIGALIFFGAVVAPVAFGQLPNLFANQPQGFHAAGLVVGGSLVKLHWMGFVCGIIFLIAVLVGRTHYRSVIPQAVLVAVMLVLTAYSQFSIIPRMDTARDSVGGSIEAVPQSNPGREIFDSLHKRSESVEMIVLIGGLAALLATVHLARDTRRIPLG